jgi:DNA topoisomerase-1
MFRSATHASDSQSSESLRYVLDNIPGYTRRPYRSGFRFFNAQGEPIRAVAILERLQTLRIPPAWVDVWICPSAEGHLQATGRDARGRKQYLYHPAWVARQSVLKYERILEFAAALPLIRRQVARDLSRRGLPKEKVLAAVVSLMESTLIRVGNEQYAKENRSYGLTTLRDRHAQVRGSCVRLRFAGKSGKWHECEVHDKRLARIVERCQDLPGQQLLQYTDQQDRVHDIGSADVNDYLHSISGHDFSAKDFRTWAATSLAISLLCAECEFASMRASKRKVVEVVDCIARRLNNTRAVCRKSYVHPGVIESYLDKSIADHYRSATRRRSRTQRGLSKQEQMAVAILRALARRSAKANSTIIRPRRNSRPGPAILAREEG